MDRLQSMRVFERVVNEGGFAAAARALDMSAPVVTRLVADLEDHLGARLLQRSTRRLSLTDTGQQYLNRIRSILQDIDEADAMASAQTSELVGLLRLHAPPVLASYVISPLLAEFRKRYPKILVELEVENLREPPIEDFDITLLGTDEGFDAHVIARKVIESEAILVASPEYLQRKGMPLEPQALMQHDCLRLKMPDIKTRLWRMWCPENPTQAIEIDIQPVLLANHTDSLLRATLDGAGITSVAIDVVAPYLTKGELVRVLAPWITGRLVIYAAVPSRKFIPQRTHVFLDFLMEETRLQKARAMAACTAI
ncbi:LysR family transcriptional regulator [Limnohabitans sp. T6-5]|uniref:LysR family transcriptional regulator n=1 Tax=Limnohabitans sp. T6-5 TaxID=1100724 RepID=UPI000D356BA4|nr:LysR family transcriptional regulator [Limnohabitans sp. T6-5]PUE06732.1 LysR family transcriptional regulator [Limnohabitans sp. T6-5]